MKTKLISTLIICSLIINVYAQRHSTAKQNDVLQYVNPMIGAAAHGHVFVGASVPWGAVQAGPTNFTQGWDWCSGYHYSDSVMLGFSQLHLSGTGVGDLGDVLMMPFVGEIRTNPRQYCDIYSHADEKVTPGFYSVKLKNSGINVALTASKRVAFHKYIFPKNAEARVIIDLTQGIGWDSPVETSIVKLNDSTLIGYRFSKGWAADQRLYFAIRISKPMKEFALYDSSVLKSTNSLTAVNTRGVLSFGKNIGTVEIKVGISPVSMTHVLKNIRAEIRGWDFDKAIANAQQQWRKALSCVQITSDDTAKKTVFYTALYHMFIAPVLFNDVDSSYRGTNKIAYFHAPFNNYSVFSLWDTYRALNPLMTVLHPELINDFVNSMLAIYQQQDKLPVWHLMGNETDCMVGYSAAPIIADAILKGFKGFDVNLAYEALKASANRDDNGLQYLKQLGYIPADKETESVSKALEYAVDDGSIALAAKYLHRQSDYEWYKKRSEYYKKYFDVQTQFMRGVLSDGSFREPFNPFQDAHHDYTEGNAWQYIWLAPQDVYGLIQLFGGDKSFVNKLDSLFVVTGNLGADAPPDISGLIGMYAHGDEPEHHVAYLYAFAGQQWKTAEKVHQISTEFYTDSPDGLCGNDDCGQMSAWYVISALGFYQVNPSNGIFVLGTPAFDKASVKVPDGKAFVITANNLSNKNIYIQSVKLNGKDYSKSYITYSDIMNGGTLELAMGAAPNKNFGSMKKDRPVE